MKIKESCVSFGLLEAIGSLQSKYNLQTIDGAQRPSLEFLKELVTLFAENLGRTMTVTEAWQAWIFAFCVADKARRSATLKADVAHWYGLNPYKLTTKQIFALAVNLPRVKAQQKLAAGNYDPADWETVYNLTLIATGDEQQALNARSNAIMAEARRNG